MAKKKRTKAARAYRRAKRLQERVASEQAVLAERRELARRQAVYGGESKPTPPETPSVSVRTVASAFEGNRRRH
ncbi:hypothetical protein [Streptomyces spiralis]|uniref:hypothetical protein n=1 Tax=Streptomyces spiralis TaxID=66376 RepID=UPI0034100045